MHAAVMPRKIDGDAEVRLAGWVWKLPARLAASPVMIAVLLSWFNVLDVSELNLHHMWLTSSKIVPLRVGHMFCIRASARASARAICSFTAIA